MSGRIGAWICGLGLVFCGVVMMGTKSSYARAAYGAPAAQAASDAEVSKALQDVERAWISAESNHDAPKFEALVADDWIGISPEGKSQTKAERAAEIKGGSGAGALTMGEMKVRVFGNTAVVTGTDDEVATKDGKKVTNHYAWTDVFVKRGGKWLAVASQTALVGSV